jgi:hypothetical protein
MGKAGAERIAMLQTQALRVHQAQETLGLWVVDARDEGFSWEGIGWCIGTSGRAAQMRWGKDAAGRPDD